MKFNMNRPMEKLLKQLGVDLERDREELMRAVPRNLRKHSSIRNVKDCLLDPSFDGDKTDQECLWSKLHISDFVDDANTPYEKKVELAIGLALLRRESLEELDPDGLFRIIVHANKDRSWPHPTAVCRFHRLWPDEEPWLWEDLDRYSNHVLTIDTEPKSASGEESESDES